MEQMVSEEEMLKRKVWLILCICCLVLNACSFFKEDEQPKQEVADEQVTLGLQPDFSYEIIEQKPHIYINKVGYETGSKKIVYIEGNNLEDTFYIVDTFSGKNVYKGSLKEMGILEETGNHMYIGDFSIVDENGNYRVYNEDVGYSYSFMIDSDPYAVVRSELEAKINLYRYETVSSCVYVLSNLMLTKEIYPDSIPDKEFLIEKMEALLLMQSAQGAFPKDYMNVQCVKEEEISLSATAEAAGVLAQFYHHYKVEEPQLAAKCLQASRKAFAYVERKRDNVDTDSWYYASAQLYRATGFVQYRNLIKEYDAIPVESRRTSLYDYTLIADWAYLSTNFATEYNRCNDIMDGYMEKAQKISLNSAKEHFSVGKNVDTMSKEEVLQDMKVLGLLCSVLGGREYRGIQENYLHFFLGANSGAVNHLEEVGKPWEEEPALKENPQWISEFLFILENVEMSYSKEK